YTEADASNISAETHQLTLDRIKASPNFGPFPSPSLRETVMFPGFDGGMEWGGGAADPEGIYYVNVNEMPWLMQLVELRRPDGTAVPRGERDYMAYCAPCHGLKGAGRMPAFDSLSDADRDAILDYVLGINQPSASPRDGTKEARDNSPPYAFSGFRR